MKPSWYAPLEPRPEHRDGSGRLMFVGHYGCSELDRVVRVRYPKRGHRPHHSEKWRIECPCGRSHVVNPMWRWATMAELRAAEVVLPLKNLFGHEAASAGLTSANTRSAVEGRNASRRRT